MSFFKKLGSAIKTGFKTAWHGIKSVAKGFGKGVKGAWHGLSSVVKHVGSGAKQVFDAGISSVVKTTKGLGNVASGVGTGLSKAAVGVGTGVGKFSTNITSLPMMLLLGVGAIVVVPQVLAARK